MFFILGAKRERINQKLLTITGSLRTRNLNVVPSAPSNVTRGTFSEPLNPSKGLEIAKGSNSTAKEKCRMVN